MSERAASLAGRPAASRWLLSTGLAGAAVVVILVAFVGAPYLFSRTTLEQEIATQVKATTGLVVSTAGGTRFGLLPRPHVAMRGLHVTDPSGTLAIEADALDGDVRLLPLLVGRVELISAALRRPRLTIDLDGRPIQPDSAIGRAMHAEEPRGPADQRLGIVSLVDGTARVRSKGFAKDLLFDAVNITVDWRDLDRPATLTGSVMFAKTNAEVAAWIAQPSSLMRGDHSAVSLGLHSAPLDISANGDLVSARTSSFHGHVAVTAPSVPAVMALAGTEITTPAPFANLALNSDATIGIDADGRKALDLPNLNLRLDGNAYEGTLAVQGGETPLVSGTLATDQLTLAPFVSRLPAMTDAAHRWTRIPVPATPNDTVALDLRISAAHMRLAAFNIDDAALAVMTRDHRTEIGLIEGKAYGGAVKARVSIGAGGDGLSLRGVGTLTEIDTSTLSWDAFGRQFAAGTSNVSANLETSGDTPAALMSHLQGWAKVNAHDGELSGVDIGGGLRALGGGKIDTVVPALTSGRTPFERLHVNVRLDGGVATIEGGTLQGTDATMALSGTADIGARKLDLDAHAVEAGTTRGSPAQMSLAIEGPFEKISIAPSPGK